MLEEGQAHDWVACSTRALLLGNGIDDLQLQG